MLDNAGQCRIGFCFLSISFIQSGSVPIADASAGVSWSHVSRALNTNADASYSFRTSFRQNLLWRIQHVQLCAVRALTLVHTVVKALDVSRRGEPTISSSGGVRETLHGFISPFVSLFLSRSIFYKTHTSFCIKQELAITQPPFFPWWSKCMDHQTPPPPRSLKAEIWGIRWNSAQIYRAWWYFVWPICISLIWCRDKEHESSLSSAAPVSAFVEKSLHRVQSRQYRSTLRPFSKV